jgi:hypothetical protein
MAEKPVITFAECRSKAEAMLTQAERDHKHRRRLGRSGLAFAR